MAAKRMMMGMMRFMGQTSLLDQLPKSYPGQGRFATKAASLPSQNQTKINHEDHEGHEVLR
jgi:hypothetical protein